VQDDAAPRRFGAKGNLLPLLSGRSPPHGPSRSRVMVPPRTWMSSSSFLVADGGVSLLGGAGQLETVDPAETAVDGTEGNVDDVLLLLMLDRNRSIAFLFQCSITGQRDEDGCYNQQLL
jgi:hypothetical protein